MATPNFPSKRHISFYSNKEYTSVCRGINLKSRCTNPACESVRSMGGLVIVKCPDRDTCVYQDAVYDLPCPSCGTVLSPKQFSGVVFVRCEASVSIGDRSELIKASQEETVSYEIEYIGPEVRIKILEREPENPPPPAYSDISQSYLFPEKGVNLVGICRHNDCLASKNNQGKVFVRVGLIECAVLQNLVKYRTCPSCNCELAVDSFDAVTFLGCRAEVEIGARVERLDATSALKQFKISASGPQAVIHVNRDPVLPPHTVTVPTTAPTPRDANPDNPITHPVHVDGSPEESSDDDEHTEMEPGINFMADCPSPGCGSVVIPSGHIVSCKYREAIRGMVCPSCKQVLSPTNFTGVGFMLCKASLETKEKRVVSQAGQTPEIYKIHAEGLEVEITVHEREHKVASKPGKLSGGSGMEYSRACSGLNIIAFCRNTECLAYEENDGQVTIQAPDATECLLSDTASGIICPSCTIAMEYSQVKKITFVRCGGEVIIGDQIEKFRAAGDHTVDFMVEPDGPEVIINISYKAQEKEDSDSSDRKYTKVCDGVNFTAFCENPDCLAVKEYDGFVNVKRDEQFIQKGGFPPNRCNYSVEVQHLRCPSCGSHLDPKFVRGVALVRCKGVIEIAGKRQNFEAKKNDFVKFELNHSDPRNFVDYEVFISFLPGPGLNVVFKCQNVSCPSNNESPTKKRAFIKFGTVTSFNVNEVMLTKTCPHCSTHVPIENIIHILFRECTAVARIKERETNYLTGSCAQSIPFEFSENIEVDILPLIARDILQMLSDDNRFFSLTMGLNVQAICSNPNCEAQLLHEGRVCIGSPEMKNTKVKELLSTLFCPSCRCPLSEMLVLCLSFVQCKAILQSSEKKFIIETASDEVIDFESVFLSADLSIQVLGLDEDIPDSKMENIKKGSVYSHASLCHGLNFQVSCINPICVSVQNHQYVNIMSGHLLDFNYRLAVQSLTCPCCSTPIPPDEVEGVDMLCCTGEVKIGDRIVKFDYSGNKTSTIKIPKDAFKVWIKVEHRTYDVITNPVLPYSLKPFQSLCKGVNFRCYCKNALCDSFNLTDGLVHVQRNVDFVNTHGYSLSVCNYRLEISRLRCPDCSVPLPQYFVWGVVLNCCSGTITRNGSPPEKFCTPSGKIVLYALDRDDRSARIEFAL